MMREVIQTAFMGLSLILVLELCSHYQLVATAAAQTVSCSNGTFVPFNETCNNIWFCDGGEDEEYCEPLSPGEILSFTSPGYPGDYPTDTVITWTFSARQECLLRFTAKDFYTEEEWDKLYFGSDAVTLHGEHDKFVYISEDSSITVYFESDASGTERGFLFDVEAILKENFCNNEVDERIFFNPCDFEWECKNGTDEWNCQPFAPNEMHSFTSPGYPENYPTNTVITWTFSTWQGYLLRFTAKNFDTERNYDQLYFGSDTVSGKHDDVVYISKDSSITVYFQSDDSLTKRGFEFDVDTVLKESVCDNEEDRKVLFNRCDFELECKNGTDEWNCQLLSPGERLSFTSPGYPKDYPSDKVTRWIFSTKQGYLLRFTAMDFITEAGADNFFFGSDGVPLHGHYDDFNIVYISEDRSITVFFESDYSKTERGFLFNVDAVLKERVCKNEEDEHVFFSSCDFKWECKNGTDEWNCPSSLDFGSSLMIFLGDQLTSSEIWVIKTQVDFRPRVTVNLIEINSHSAFVLFGTGYPNIEKGNLIVILTNRTSNGFNFVSSKNEVWIRVERERYRSQIDFQAEVDVIMPTTQEADIQCPDDWVLFSESCYRLQQYSLSWLEASEHCKSLGSNLVSINSKSEHVFSLDLILTLGNRTETFIGLRLKNDKQYIWDDGKPFTFSDFAKGEPSSPLVKRCGKLYGLEGIETHTWFDVSCATEILEQFICEIHVTLTKRTTSSVQIPKYQSKYCPPSFLALSDRCVSIVPVDENITQHMIPSCPTGSRFATAETIESNNNLIEYYSKSSIISADNDILLDEDELNCTFLQIIPDIYVEVTGCNKTVKYIMCQTDLKAKVQTCQENQFRCTSGECILNSFRCDGSKDCDDDSDEKNCFIEEDSCKDADFQCRNGECIPLIFHCDTEYHCSDGSDERSCHYPGCGDDEFWCSDEICVHQTKRCNLIADCPNGEDEENCVSSSGNFLCSSGVFLPPRAVEDGFPDCIETDEDESKPETFTYPFIGGTYLFYNWICDAPLISCENAGCYDTSLQCIYEFDEYGYLKACRNGFHLQDCEYLECPLFYFKCPRSYCIPQRYRCNGNMDCIDGEDEIDCESYVCPDGSYRCHKSKVCITQDEICDGVKQCSEGDDEIFCGLYCPIGCVCEGLTLNCENIEMKRESTKLISKRTKKMVLKNVTTDKQENGTDSKVLPISILDVIEIKRLPFLISLEISYSGISYIYPDTFAFNLNLQILNLSYNDINTLHSGMFSGLEELRKLYLTGNPITKVEPIPFSTIPTLVHLDIRDCPLNDSSDDFLDGLYNLEKLHSDRFYFCCLVETNATLVECLPDSDQFSSCSDLIRIRPLRIFMWILGLSAIIGNFVVVVFRLVRKNPSPNSSQAIFVTNLACADFLVGVYMIIIAIADLSYQGSYYKFSENWRTSTICKMAGFLVAFGSEASVMFLTVITVDRCYNVIFPLSTRKLRRSSSVVLSGVVWFLIFIFTAAPTLPTKYFGRSFYGRSSVCLALPLVNDYYNGWLYSVFLFIILNFVCFILIALCYLSIYIIAYKSGAMTKKDTQRKEQLALAGKMAFLIGTDFACWMPIIIIALLSLTGVVSVSADMYAWTAIFILPINSSLNPYLYTYIVKTRKRKKTIESSASSQLYTSNAVPDDESNAGNKLKSIFDNVLNLNRVSLPILSGNIKRHLLSFLRTRENFVITDYDKSDIEADVKNGLAYLHKIGIIHGSVSEDFIIIEQTIHGNKRAYLMLPSVLQTKSSTEVGEQLADEYSIDLDKEREKAADLDDLERIVKSLSSQTESKTTI